jgi:hypothetical protein
MNLSIRKATRIICGESPTLFILFGLRLAASKL